MKSVFIATAHILAGALLLLAGCTSTSAHDKCCQRTSTALDSLLVPIFDGDGPGAIVLVAHADSVIYNQGFGYADLQTRQPVCDTTLFNICSISKQFAAVALLKLQEEGRLSLDDKVSDYFPKFKAPFFKEITLRHLLSHTSGIPDVRPRTRSEWEEYVHKHPTAFASVRDYKRFALTHESIRYMEDLDSLAFPPGTAYEYQNPTYQLVLPLVEKLTGQRFPQWMDSVIFRPCGMENTVYFDFTVSQPQLSHAYRPATGANVEKFYRSPDGKWEEYDFGEADFFPTKADGGLYTSAAEFLKWNKALFGGKVLGDSAMAQAFTPIIGTDLPRTSYGLGFFIEHRAKGKKKIFHTGDNGAYLTVEAYFPDEDLTYIIFANRCDWDREDTVDKLEEILAREKWI